MPDGYRLRDYSRSRAVVMGTWDYDHLPPVQAVGNSLQRMRSLLTGPLCGWPEDRVLVLANERSPGDLPDRLITAFEHVTDVALFYYVGHGQIDADDQLCLGLVGSRIEPNRRASTSLPFHAVRRALLDSRAVTKIVILDCCFAGVANQPANTLAALADDVLQKTTGTGAYTMTASGPDTTAWYETDKDTPRPQTYFTRYLADLIETGIPGQAPGLRLHPLFSSLHDSLARDKRPIPHERSVDAARDFVFARNAAPPATHRDPDMALQQLNKRLAETEAQRAQEQAEARAREEALRAEVAKYTRELERLKKQALNVPPTAPEQQRLQAAIQEAGRRLGAAQATVAGHADTSVNAAHQQPATLAAGPGVTPTVPAAPAGSHRARRPHRRKPAAVSEARRPSLPLPRWLRGLRMWQFALIAIPTVAVIAYGSVRLATTSHGADSNQRIERLAFLGGDATKLAQAMEDERDLTAGFIGGGRPPSGQHTLHNQYAITDSAAAAVRANAPTISSGYPASTRQLLANVLTRISDLQGLRAAALQSKLPALPMIMAYSQAIGAIFQFDDQIGQGSTNRALNSDVSALGLLSRMKDQASQQRAILYASFIAGQITPGELDALTAAQAQQASELSTFMASASASQQQQYADTVTAAQDDQALNLEQHAITLGNSNTPLLSGTTSSLASQTWYSAISTTINQMRAVENQMIGSIIAQSRAP